MITGVFGKLIIVLLRCCASMLKENMTWHAEKQKCSLVTETDKQNNTDSERTCKNAAMGMTILICYLSKIDKGCDVPRILKIRLGPGPAY